MSSGIPSTALPNSTTLRDLLRLDLADAAGTSATWSDADLDRHISHALDEYSLAWPYRRTATLTATNGSRDIGLSTQLTKPIAITAVEWPIDRYPRELVDFSYDNPDGTLRLNVPTAPATGNLSVRVYYDALHIISASQLTARQSHWALILLGAAGYAAQQWASEGTNKVNLDARAVGHYLEQARRNLSHFHAELQVPGKSTGIKRTTLYTPELRSSPSPTQSSDPGP